jgi:hypothetical protein
MLTDADDTASAAPVAVLSYRSWQDEFGGNPSVVGSTILIKGTPVVIAGFAQRGFFGDRITETPPAICVPLALVQHIVGDSDMFLAAHENWHCRG